MKEIKFRISGSKVDLEVVGANGRECLDITSFLEKMDGARISERRMKVAVGEGGMKTPAEVRI